RRELGNARQPGTRWRPGASNLDSRSSNRVEVSCGCGGHRGGNRNRSERPSHQGVGGSSSLNPAAVRAGWWLGRFRAAGAAGGAGAGRGGGVPGRWAGGGGGGGGPATVLRGWRAGTGTA